jgi:hypothetical protein
MISADNPSFGLFLYSALKEYFEIKISPNTDAANSKTCHDTVCYLSPAKKTTAISTEA